MKRIVLSLILLFALVGGASAQRLTVESFRAASTDLSASTSPRLDLNGQPCGLVKVQLAAMGAEFSGNVIGDCEYRTGEYWVYMTKGSYLLKVKLPNVVPLEVSLRDYGIRGIEPKTTYVLTLLLPQTVQSADDGMRYLTVSVVPKDSKVTIDGAWCPVEDGVATKLLAVGSHRYTVEAPGYATVARDVLIAETDVREEVTLRSLSSAVTISCPTEGAQIWVNNQLRGPSPWRGSLVPGSYRIEARREGYHPATMTRIVGEGTDLTVDLPALQPMTGSLRVNVRPYQSEVWLDGSRKGQTPATLRDIVVGRHDLEVIRQGYKPLRQTVVVRDGQVDSLVATLSPSSGSDGRQPALYLLASLQAGSLMGVVASLGTYIGNFNVEASYLLGLSKSEDIYWNAVSGAQEAVVCQYKPSAFGLKLGYRLAMGSAFSITPQVGANIVQVKADQSTCNVTSATVGARLGYSVTRAICLLLAPEYDIAISKSDIYQQLEPLSSKIKGWGTGFNVRVALTFSF